MRDRRGKGEGKRERESEERETERRERERREREKQRERAKREREKQRERREREREKRERERETEREKRERERNREREERERSREDNQLCCSSLNAHMLREHLYFENTLLTDHRRTLPGFTPSLSSSFFPYHVHASPPPPLPPHRIATRRRTSQISPREPASPSYEPLTVSKTSTLRSRGPQCSSWRRRLLTRHRATP